MVGKDEPRYERRWFIGAVYATAMVWARENGCAAAVAKRAQLCREWDDYERHVAPCLDEYRDELPSALVAVMETAEALQ